MNKKQSLKMNNARERKRLESPKPDSPIILPDLRCRITIEQFDFGYRQHILELFKTSRKDCYMVYVNDKLWKWKVGMSKILEGIRKSMPRVSATI